MRIDFVLVPRQLVVAEYLVLKEYLISDHRPVLATIYDPLKNKCLHRRERPFSLGPG